jgi:hypothetical protein
VKVTTAELLEEAADLVEQIKEEVNPDGGHDMDTFDSLIARMRIITQVIVTAKHVEYKL